MRLDRIALKGFQSHIATDWSPDGARLVTIVGSNGAGKSALLDGFRFALFGKARTSAEWLVRTGSSEMSALTEFEFAGARYRIARGRTSRAGGKPFLELHVSPDGQTWTPLTGDDIRRETQPRIEALLGLNADAFLTAVVLAQGQQDRFTNAAAADRKRVLSSLLPHADLWPRAEARAKELVRELDVSLAAERARVERLTADADALAGADEELRAADEGLAHNGSLTALALQKREEAEGRLRDLAASLASVDAAQADVRRLEAELEDQKGRWRRAEEARKTAEAAATRATAALGRAQDVETAVGLLPDARARVEALEAAERADDEALTRVAAAEKRLSLTEQAHARTVAAHEQTRERRAEAVAALEDQLAHLSLITCPNCAHEFAADPGDVAARLKGARDLLATVGDLPGEPAELGRDRVAAERARKALEKAAFDPAAMAAARREMLALERTAAEAGAMEAQRAALQDARQHLASARTELGAIEAAGKAAREALEAARSKLGEGGVLRVKRELTEGHLAAVLEGLRALDAERTTLTVARARATAALEQRSKLVAERDAAAATIAGAEVELARYRRLVAAFGIKGIPARTIESVIPELVAEINEFIGELFPGMTIDLRTQRATKDGEGVIEALDIVIAYKGVRPIESYSGGERTAIDLGIGIGLSRLVARRATAAIRTFCVDEPDGLDAEHRRALGQLLKRLAHRGDLERIVLITHTPDLAEFGDATYQVRDDGAGSVVELAA